jgi:hypothetical protein
VDPWLRHTPPGHGAATRLALGDLGCEGGADRFRITIKKPKGGTLTIHQHSCNAVQGALRRLGERATPC